MGSQGNAKESGAMVRETPGRTVYERAEAKRRGEAPWVALHISGAVRWKTGEKVSKRGVQQTTE